MEMLFKYQKYDNRKCEMESTKTHRYREAHKVCNNTGRWQSVM